MSAPFDALGGSRRSSLVSGTQSLRRDDEPHRVSSGALVDDILYPGLATPRNVVSCVSNPGAQAMELLEREQHLAQLEEHLCQAATGQGRLVLVGGEAGVGKTALVDEFARHV